MAQQHVLSKVNGNISDLFFNTEHHYAPPPKKSGVGGTYPELESEAKDFLACLGALGVTTPTVEELVADFYARL